MRILPLLPSMLGAVLCACSSSSSSGGGRRPSGPPVTLAAALTDPYAIAVGSAGVYWSNVRNAAGTIMAAPTDGGSVTTIASGQLRELTALARDVLGFIRHWNRDEAHPFRWTFAGRFVDAPARVAA